MRTEGNEKAGDSHEEHGKAHSLLAADGRVERHHCARVKERRGEGEGVGNTPRMTVARRSSPD